jgi:hypothetical protein
MKMMLKLLVGIFLLSNTSGCATIQPTIKGLQEKLVDFWKNIKGEERQIKTREESIRKYQYKGLQDELFIEAPVISPNVVNPGDKIKQEFKYTLLAPKEEKKFIVSEKVVLSSSKDTIDLPERKSEKTQGTHLSIIQFIIPEDLESGEYKLITTIITGKQKKTVSASFKVSR